MEVNQDVSNYLVNNVSDNIDNVVNDYVSADEGSIPKNNDVNDGFARVNEGVTKDAGGKRLPQMFLLLP